MSGSRFTRCFRSHWFLSLPVWLILPLALACGGGSSSGGSTPAPGFKLSSTVSPSTPTFTQGVAANVLMTVSIKRDPGFTAPVWISVSGLPSGIVSFDGLITSSASSTSVELSGDGSQMAGSYPIKLETIVPNKPKQNLLLNLVVAPPPPAFALASGSPSFLVHPGNQGSTIIDITRSGGFSGSVALSLSGAPAGVSGAFSPANAAGGSSTLTLQVGASTAPGTYPLQVNGQGSGVPDANAKFYLLVDGSGSSLVTLTANPLMIGFGFVPLVGFQDGDGAWALAPEDGNGDYQFIVTDPGGRFGASTTWAGTLFYYFSPSTRILKTTVAETPAPTLPQPAFILNGTVSGGDHASGTVAGLANGDSSQVAIGSGSIVVSSSAPGFNLDVNEGTLDIAATRMPSGTTIADRLLLSRGGAVVNGVDINVGTLDVGHGLVLPPATLSVGGLGAGTGLYGEVRFTTAFSGLNSGSQANVVLGAATTSTLTFGSIPAGSLQSGDLFTVDAGATMSDGSGHRSAVAFSAAPPSGTLQLPADMAAPVVSSTSFVDGYVQPKAQWSLLPGTQWTDLLYRQSDRDIAFDEIITPGWSAAAPGGADTLPDLRGLPGWTSLYSLISGDNLDWIITQVQTPTPSGTPGVVPAPADGSSYTTEMRSGSLQP